MTKRLSRVNLDRVPVYEPGKPVEEVKRELGLGRVIKMASNENALGPSPRASVAIRKMARKVNVYPEGSAHYLRQRLSSHLGVPPENLIFGNGSDEIIRMVVETFLDPGEEVVISEGSFLIYLIAVRIMNGADRQVKLDGWGYDMEAMARATNEKTRLVFVANPNNPTGTMVTREEAEKFLDQVPATTIVVFDEAYFEYIERDDFPRSIDYVKEGRNVIVLRSFSKIYGLAGLRIGYGVARPEIVEAMNRVRQPFNTNAVAQAAARAALKDKQHLEGSRTLNREGKKQLYKGFKRLGLDYVPSEANFVLVDLGSDAAGVVQTLLHRGIIVRGMVGYGFPNCLRVTVGKKGDNKSFLRALGEILGREAK